MTVKKTTCPMCGKNTFLTTPFTDEFIITMEFETDICDECYEKREAIINMLEAKNIPGLGILL